MNKSMVSNSAAKSLEKLKNIFSKLDNKDFKDELLIFMIVMNIMLLLILFNFYIQD